MMMMMMMKILMSLINCLVKLRFSGILGTLVLGTAHEHMQVNAHLLSNYTGE